MISTERSITRFYTLVKAIFIYKTFVLSPTFLSQPDLMSNGLTSLAHQEFSIPPTMFKALYYITYVSLLLAYQCN